MFFDAVKYYYDTNRYDNDKVKVFVKAKMITEEEYKKITGVDYMTS